LHEQFRQFQDRLGEIHDRIRFSELLKELAQQKRLPEDLTIDLQTELSSQKLVLWQRFLEQWQIMTPQWFAKAILSAIMRNNSD
jgi:CHAD domain-containing protein